MPKTSGAIGTASSGHALPAWSDSFNLPKLDAGAVQAMLARLREAGTTTVLDPGWDPGGWQPATLRALYRWLPEVTFCSSIETRQLR